MAYLQLFIIVSGLAMTMIIIIKGAIDYEDEK